MATVKPMPLESLATHAGRRRSGALLVFCAALVIYGLFFGGHYLSGDHAERIAWAKSLIDHHFGRGSTDISAYMSAEARVNYCKYGIGHSLLHVPFILLARAVQRLTHISCEGPVNMLPYVLNGAAGVLLVYLLLRRMGLSDRSAAWRAIVIGVATAWFPYTKVEYGETLVATALLGVWYFGLRRPLLSGILAGAALTIRFDALLWGLITLLALLARARQQAQPDGGDADPPMSQPSAAAIMAALAWIAAGMMPALALVAWSNVWRTGKPLLAGYEMGFIYPLLAGVDGLLFSSGKSVFLFSPLLVLLIPAAWRAIAIDRPANRLALERRATALWAIVLLSAQVLFYARWWDWSGDDSWGPRFLIPGVMAGLVVVGSVPFSSAGWRWAWGILAAAGIGLQLPAVLVGPHESLLLTRRRGAMKVNQFGPRSLITLDDERFNPRYSQVAASFELLELKLTGSIPHSTDRRLSGATWAECFNPPLQRSDVHFDLFWLDPLHRSAQRREAAGTTLPAADEPPDSLVPQRGIQDTAHRWEN